MIPRERIAPLLCLSCLLLTVTSAAAQYETPGDRSAKAILGTAMVKGAAYRINEIVPTDGYTDRWTVDSDHGRFEVNGDGALRKLLFEIHAIGELKKASKTKAFAQGLASSAKAPISFVRSLVTYPVDTVSGIPKGAYGLVENLATSVTETRNPAEDPRYAQALRMSSYKRDLASKLNVDVYSSNTELQKHLNSVAWAATLGDWALLTAMLPGGTGGSLVSNVLMVNSLRNVLKEEPPHRLRIINDEKLTAMGINEDLRKRFLDNQQFTPTHMTIITANLERLGSLTGRDAFLAVASHAQDDTQANFYMAMAQVLRGFHETVAPLTGLIPINRFVVAQTKTGQALVALPVDRLLWLDRVDLVSARLKSQYAPPGFNGTFDLWITGTASPLAKQQMAARGFTVTENVGSKVEVID